MMDFYDILLAQKLSGGGGGGGGGDAVYEKVYEEDIVIPSTTSTSQTIAKTITIEGLFDDADYILTKTELVGERIPSHFVGVNAIQQIIKVNNSVSLSNRTGKGVYMDASRYTETKYLNYGVFIDTYGTGRVDIDYAYNSNYSKAIGGTYRASVYKIKHGALPTINN